MKKTQWIELKSNVRSTRTTFLALTVSVLLGFAVFLGFTWGGMGMRHSLDRSFDMGNMYDTEITFPLSVKSDALDALCALPEVESAEGGYTAYEHLTVNGQNLLCAVSSLPHQIGTPTSFEGRLPQTANEIAVEAGCAAKLGIRIGDTVTVRRDDGRLMRLLNDLANDRNLPISETALQNRLNEEIFFLRERTLTVTALLVSPSYISTSALSYGMSPREQIQVAGVFLCCPRRIPRGRNRRF